MAIHGYPGGIISSTAPTVSPSSASGVWTLDDQLQNSANWPLTPTLLTNSVRLRGSATPYMVRTPTIAGNQRTWTWSGWVKVSKISATDRNTLFSVPDSTGHASFQYDSNGNKLAWNPLSAANGYALTNAVFRDPSSWYHVVFAFDSTQATASNRIRIWVNNVLQTFESYTAPTQNQNTPVNSIVPHYIGVQSNLGSTTYFDGYLAAVTFVDGQALDPSYFGATDPNTGVWEPSQYKGTFGTNGFYLPMNIDALQKTFSRSLRFRASAGAYLSRTLSTSGNTNQWTFSTWLKRGALAATSGNPYQYCIFSAGTFGSVAATNALFFNAADSVLQFYIYDGSNFLINCDTSPAVFRDPSAWYHVVVAFDGQNATAANRVRMYVNGVQYTLRYVQNTTASSYINNSSYTQLIGRDPRPGSTYENPFDGYMAEVNFVDGLILTPYDFGQIDSTSGAWQPITYTGTYGTNGYYLPFTNTTSLTTLTADSSGRGNNWTANNISLTAGATYDSMTDVPTLTDINTANYCTFNPLNATVQTLGGQVLDVTQGNLYAGVRNTILMGTLGGIATGKYYWEVTLGNSEFVVGVATPQINLNASYPRYVGQGPYGWGYGPSNGNCFHNGSLVTATGVTATTNDVIGIAIDLDNQKMFLSKNGVWMNGGNPVTGAGAVFSNISNTDYVIPCFSDGGGASAQYGYLNCGQRPFAYTPPSGFLALNAFNI